MCVDDREGWWEEDGEGRVVADRVDVEDRYLERAGVVLDESEDDGVYRRSDENESVVSEDLVLGDKRLDGL